MDIYLFPSRNINKKLTERRGNAFNESFARLMKKPTTVGGKKGVLQSHSTATTGSAENQTSPIRV